MKWVAKQYEWDGETQTAYHCDTPIGEVVVDYGPWLDEGKPWTASWYPSVGDEVRLGDAASDGAAKVIALDWLRKIEAGIGNVLAQGFEQPGDGA